MMENLLAAIDLVFRLDILLVILGACVFGIFAGAIPGISATVAVALLVPITFFMEPVAALAAIATAVAMAIFAGDLPGALLRIPGTPASAAYAEEAHEMTRKGQGANALTIALFCSVLGGVVGTLALSFSAPLLAEFSLEFQYYEYFWLACIGLSTAALVSATNPVKGLVSLSIGLLLAMVGLDLISGAPRFTFGTFELMEGIHFIPVMIGVFAVAEVMRNLIHPPRGAEADTREQPVDYRAVGRTVWRYRNNVARGSLIGTLVGALPGAGSDIASWVSFGVAKRFSRTPEKFGTGHPEGIVAASASNNAATCSTWIPSIVFGIPGDSVTAIVIGVLFLKGLEPGPTVFVENAPLVYSIFVAFLIANLFLIPVGYVAIKLAKQLLRVPRDVLMPIILVFTMVGAYAINNSMMGIATALAAGILSFFMQENDYPVAPLILGMVIGVLLEENFMQAMIAQRGDLTAFFGRPIAAVLGTVTILIWLAPIAAYIARRRKAPADPKEARAGSGAGPSAR
ncbi:tripartite tricarboxylate transporter permease [Marivibrio halodurans]|uniref:Tripartite tricarboxylate transporter permease n=2 Tax=Marivibrio halodurans TaxID=2039722 RepID=A0A8J7S4W6_9PROT|nr:tripartite tricarboxylate transporter permease [Marivibrio halodurans]